MLLLIITGHDLMKLVPLLSGIVGVQIRDLRVPPAVESGSQPHVILDCDYDLSETESSQVDVKWYFRDDPQPFFQASKAKTIVTNDVTHSNVLLWFQWLPGRPPQAIGELFENGRLDLSYEVDTHGDKTEFKKHRALKIMHPTIELTGTYRCKVSSFVDEDFMQKKMIIYCKKAISFLVASEYVL